MGGYSLGLYLLVGEKEKLEQSTESNVYKRPVKHEFGSTLSMSMTFRQMDYFGLN